MPQLRYKHVIKRDIAGFFISPQSWETQTFAADRDSLHRWAKSGVAESAGFLQEAESKNHFCRLSGGV